MAGYRSLQQMGLKRIAALELMGVRCNWVAREGRPARIWKDLYLLPHRIWRNLFLIRTLFDRQFHYDMDVYIRGLYDYYRHLEDELKYAKMASEAIEKVANPQDN